MLPGFTDEAFPRICKSFLQRKEMKRFILLMSVCVASQVYWIWHWLAVDNWRWAVFNLVVLLAMAGYVIVAINKPDDEEA